MTWMPYPRPGTTVLPGRWLCSVKNLHTGTLSTEILTLDEDGKWRADGFGYEIISAPDEAVVAIDHVPEPKEFT